MGSGSFVVFLNTVTSRSGSISNDVPLKISKMNCIRQRRSPNSFFFNSSFFKEFLLNFDDCGLTVREINKELRNRNIFGGKDLSNEYPELGQCALYCVTEVHA